MRYLFFITSSILLFYCTTPEEKNLSYSDQALPTPQLFAPGIISTDNYNEFDLCFTPDGKTIYFTRRIPATKQKIYSSNFVNGNWTQPTIASFSTDRDETPFITPDGNTFYFGSQREIPGKPNRGGFDMNVWMMSREGDQWSSPRPLPEPINHVQIEGENWPSSNNNFLFTLDGKTHYFTAMQRGSPAIDIYTTQLENDKFSSPQKIVGLFEQDSIWKYSASLSPDGKYLTFNCYQAPGGKGGEDLYVSQKTESGWSRAVNMGDLVNTPGEEGSGRFSPDGRYFFFTHAENLGNEEYGLWSIYYIETEYLRLAHLFK